VSRHYPDAHGAAIACPGLGQRRPMRQLGGPNVEKLTAKCDVKGLAKALPTGPPPRTPVI